MKKYRNTGLIVLLSIILVFGIGIIVYRFLYDENALSLQEKKYVNDSASKMIDVKILNDANIFGNAGKGVFYDFLSSIETDRKLKFNKISISDASDNSDLTLSRGVSVPENAKIIYTDHFVLVGKSFKTFVNVSDIDGTIGVLSRDRDTINRYLSVYGLDFKDYDTMESLTTGLTDGEVMYVAVPMIEYLDTILSNLYSIDYHFSNIKDYYYMTNSSNDVLTSIMNKSYNTWSKSNFNESFNRNEYELFISKLKLTEKELDVIGSREYTYGFVINAPYDIKSGGTYGGVMNQYLESFSEFSGLTFNYKNYDSFSKLSNAFNKKNIDLFSNAFGSGTNTSVIGSLYTVDMSVVMSLTDNRTYTDLTSLSGETLYIKRDSSAIKYFEGLGYNVKTFKDAREARDLLKKNNILIMDYLEYLVFQHDNDNVSERFRINTSLTYNFETQTDTMFNRLFTYYISTIDKNEIVHTGLENYYKTVTSGRIIYKITQYTLFIVLAIAIVAYIVYKLGKKVHIKKRIKKSDKMKYIDLLTSLKNRNFLNENLAVWNQNTIYPQAIILIDLNDIQELNDAYGYIEGDKQIQAFANILIKTQIDNTEIMRTDGNEFTIYMVGYNEKQVLSYIKKLNKEIKTLPHDKGAAIGFAMIEDDLKLIGDAINEATEVMKKNKELKYEVEDEGKD